MKALVTAFEPFGGDAVNPSSLAVERLGKKYGSVVVQTATLPCSFARSTRVLKGAIDKAEPDFVLCVGLAGGRSELCLERGINVQDARIRDNDGRQPIDKPVVKDGPAAHFATLPIKACVAAMRQAGLAAAVSNTAGTFVCNHILYALMDIASRHPTPLRGGFLHVPYAPEQIAKVGTAPSMAVADVTRGIEIILQVSAERTTDIHTAEGKIALTLPDTPMNPLWSQIARELSPYVPGEQPRVADLVKLNTNESPFGPSPLALEAMRAAAADTLRLYPDPDATELREALAAHHGVKPAQVFVGNGSDEVLAHAFVALLKQPRPLLFPDVTYSFFPVWAQLFGLAWEAVPLDGGMCVRIEDYRREAGSIVIANPNAPTGVALPRATIARLLEEHPGIPVLIDEAYVDFGGESAVPLIADHPNLLVVQTMSKARALAGLRVGYALGDAGLIEALRRVKDSFNSYPLGSVAQAGATASVRDEAHFRESCARVVAGREAMTRELIPLGFVVLPSSANFVFARHPARSGSELVAGLRRHGVLVRHFDKPRTAPYLRITVGTENDTRRLIAAAADILRAE